MKRRIWMTVSVLLVAVLMMGCSDRNNGKVKKKPSLETQSYQNLKSSTVIKDYKIGLLSETGNRDKIYVSAKEGLKRLQTRLQCQIKLSEYDESDFEKQVKDLVADDCKMIWILGTQAKTINIIAEKYPDIKFAVVDEYYNGIRENVIVINFKYQELSFLCGFVAAESTKTGTVGIMYTPDEKGTSSLYGFKAGMEYSKRQNGSDTKLSELKLGDDLSEATIYQLAKDSYADGADILYVTDGTIDQYVTRAAKETSKFIIGMGEDIVKESPDNVITYSKTEVDSAVELVSFHAMSGEDISGVAYQYGYSEGAVDLAEINNTSMLKSQLGLAKELILGGESIIPTTNDEYSDFLKTLDDQVQ